MKASVFKISINKYQESQPTLIVILKVLNIFFQKYIEIHIRHFLNSNNTGFAVKSFGSIIVWVILL